MNAIPREKASFEDFKIATYLCFTNFKGSQHMFKWRRNNWYDKELQMSIGIIENLLLPFFIGLIGLVLVSVWAEKFLAESTMLPAIIVWLIFDIFILNPLMYFFALPKPIRAHIKKVEDLSEVERKIYEEEKNSNKRVEKILKRYKITGRNKYTD